METNYKLNYKEHITLKQAAFIIMQTHNKNQLKNKTTNYLNLNQTLQILYKKPKLELLDIIQRYKDHIQKQDNNKLIQFNQSQIIINKLKDLTDQQLESISNKIQQLELKYYLQLDTDYTNKQSIIQSYQQILAYKHYNIELQPRSEEETLIGNLEILDKI